MEKARSKYTDKFEFILRINDHIVCQRYFNIRGYSNVAKDSMDLKWELNEIVSTIQSYLRDKSEDFLWTNYNPYSSKNSVVREEKKDGEDYFTFEIRVDGISTKDKVFSKCKIIDTVNNFKDSEVFK